MVLAKLKADAESKLGETITEEGISHTRNVVLSL